MLSGAHRDCRQEEEPPQRVPFQVPARFGTSEVSDHRHAEHSVTTNVPESDEVINHVASRNVAKSAIVKLGQFNPVIDSIVP